MSFVGEWHRKGKKSIYGEPDFSWNALTEGRRTTLKSFQKGRPMMVQTRQNSAFSSLLELRFFSSMYEVKFREFSVFLILLWSKFASLQLLSEPLPCSSLVGTIPWVLPPQTVLWFIREALSFCFCCWRPRLTNGFSPRLFFQLLMKNIVLPEANPTFRSISKPLATSNLIAV